MRSRWDRVSRAWDDNWQYILVIAMVALSILFVIVGGRYYATRPVTCIGGYQFTNPYSYPPTQILNDQGHGIRCEEEK